MIAFNFNADIRFMSALYVSISSSGRGSPSGIDCIDRRCLKFRPKVLLDLGERTNDAGR
jgi:hypothetical protein